MAIKISQYPTTVTALSDDDLFDVSKLISTFPDVFESEKLPFSVLKDSIKTNFWSYDGNTVASEKFIGTLDAFDLPIQVNGIEVGRFGSGGVGMFTVYSSNYGLSHTDGTVQITSYTEGTLGWIGTKSAHDFAIFTNDGSAQHIFKQSGDYYINGGKIVASVLSTPSGSEINFGAGQTVLITTDNSASNEGLVSLSSTSANIGFGSLGYLQFTSVLSTLSHNTQITFNSPIYHYTTLSADTVPVIDGSNNMVSSTVTQAQLNYLSVLSAPIATQAYVDSAVLGLLDDRGNFDASGNLFPATGGSGTAGAILKGDLWTISVAGIIGGHVVTAGDVVRALTDTPGQTDANWAIGENNFGYVALNQALADSKIYLGSAGGIGTAVTVSGAFTFNNVGVATIANSYVTNSMLVNSSITINGTPISLGGSVSGLALTASSLAQFAATTSAELRGVLSDENGTGPALFNNATSPTFLTDITTPKVIGGTSVASAISYVGSTNAAVTSTAAAHNFFNGNNGTNPVASIYNDSQFVYSATGTLTRNPGSLGTFRIMQGTSVIDIGELQAGVAGIWMAGGTPTNSNYALRHSSASLLINHETSTSSVGLATAGSSRLGVTLGGISMTPGISTSGSTPAFGFTLGSSTGQTASTETINFNIDLSNTFRFANGAKALQRGMVVQQPVWGGTSGATTVITDAATFGIASAPTVSTFASITNSHGLLISALSSVSATNSYGLTVNAQTGATNNYAAQFLGGNVGFGISAPTSTLHFNGSFATAYVEKTATYTATSSDYSINCTANTFTINLPTAVGITGRIYVITNSGAGVITVDASGSQTINAALTQSILPGLSMTIQSTNSNWIII